VSQRLCMSKFLEALLEQPRMEQTEPRAVSCRGGKASLDSGIQVLQASAAHDLFE